ncbi:hypothetical protein E1B28_010305 [Marasmius oreades]|uniref:N-acetyltransferase domain-containing protein n=1 Tax=Marasmius oreades TaxID=181124 RepID=A0A9P7RWV5_9AGAR|nr:uncharacterized protein E1B28_010305 [Marasmius oreades]KAG7091256.1 hypothetical protein E1B28_010305 [Marasmius oreades]
MPALTTAINSSFGLNAYTKASKVPRNVRDALSRHPIDSNCILPALLKALDVERLSRSPPSGQLWIVCQSAFGIELVVSCTNNPLGEYPIFITSLYQLPNAALRSRIQEIAKLLLRITGSRRVYSVFAPDSIADMFSEAWSGLTRIQAYPKPYYAAKLSYCTRDTLNDYDNAPNYYLRPAQDSDLNDVARLCHGFADDSAPFFLSEEGAYLEAEHLIQTKQVWVHAASNGRQTAIASIVAFTRNSETNATITKVFTNPDFRGQGCAKRLVRRVCEHLLFKTGKSSVALFVAHDNAPASRVYHNVGFVGLDGTERDSRQAPSWKEIGFDRKKVELGHW